MTRMQSAHMIPEQQMKTRHPGHNRLGSNIDPSLILGKFFEADNSLSFFGHPRTKVSLYHKKTPRPSCCDLGGCNNVKIESQPEKKGILEVSGRRIRYHQLKSK